MRYSAVLLTLLLAACGAPTSRQPPDPATSPTSNPASNPSDGPGCGPAEITIAARDHPEDVCLTVGATLTLSSGASELQPWTSLTSSDVQILDCTSELHDDGSVTGLCTALRSGTTTVSTHTSPFAGDPHGPPQYEWRLTVEVQG